MGILRENVSRLGEGMSKFLASGDGGWGVGGDMSDIQDMSDLTKICSKTNFMKKSCHQEVIEITFPVSKCSKSLS